jgi:hypothetical protein
VRRPVADKGVSRPMRDLLCNAGRKTLQAARAQFGIPVKPGTQEQTRSISPVGCNNGPRKRSIIIAF